MTTVDQAWRPTLPPHVVVAHRVGRIAALTSALCVALHAPMVTAAAMSAMTAVVMVALSVACVVCSIHLWKGPTVRDWAAMGALATAMTAVHYMSMATSPGIHHSRHSGHAVQATESGPDMSVLDSMSWAVDVATLLNAIQVITSSIVLASWKLHSRHSQQPHSE